MYPSSFIGSVTNPIRQNMINRLINTDGYYLKYSNWVPSVPMENFYHFKDITEKSEFCLCPRGYGKSSFRLYESMQLGAIPVYVSDKHFLPWEKELDWTKFCVIVKENEIENIPQILRSISLEQKQEMRENAQKIYDEYFSLEGVCNKIMKAL